LHTKKCLGHLEKRKKRKALIIVNFEERVEKTSYLEEKEMMEFFFIKIHMKQSTPYLIPVFNLI
jgi:hypothetical protein